MKLLIPFNFSRLTREELLAFCRELYKKNGITAFTYPALKSIPKLYFSLYSKDLSQKTLLQELGIDEEYKRFILSISYKYGTTLRKHWTWNMILEKVLPIKKSEGRLPPALWFQKNGQASIVAALYNLGHTWDELREAVGDFTDSNFVQSRNGLRWLSHAEASLSNFLYARGIEHKKGERYDKSFADFSDARYAIYDLHFLGKNREWCDVEVWGDKPNGHNEEQYAKTRASKEAFNSDNTNFLGIQHADCYEEEKLGTILYPYIGNVAPFQFDKPTDPLIHSTHWSNADELLEFCTALASKMPNREFPTEEWLRKRGKWSDRDGETYNTLSVYIKQWLGGIRNLRKLIGQAEVSTQQWDKGHALAAYKAFYEKHELTPQQLRHKNRRKADFSVSEEDVLEATRIASAVQKYAGGASAANESLGIKIAKQVKWSKATTLEALKQLVDKYGLSPNQLIYDQRKGRINLPSEKLKLIKQLNDAVQRFPGGLAGIYVELGIEPPRRKRS